MSPRSSSSTSRYPSPMASPVMKSWMSPVVSRRVANDTFPWRRSSTIRPATAANSPVPSSGARESNFRWSSAASTSLSKRRANGSTPSRRRRSRVSRLAFSSSWRRPLDSASSGGGSLPAPPGGDSFIAGVLLVGVLVVDETKAFQREPWLVVIDGLAVRHHHLGQAPRGDGGGVASQLLLDALDHAVHLGRRPVQQARLDGLGGALCDDRSRSSN